MNEIPARIIIETILRSALRQMKQHPERGMRNMIDMAMSACQGRFSPRFFAAAQRMLEKEDSAYYALIRDIAAYADHERLLTFGMNVGYNACTLGATTIRGIEVESGFNIPWALYLSVEPAFLRAHADEYARLIIEAKALGIYAFFIDAAGLCPELIELVRRNDDCAFVLMLAASDLAGDAPDSLASLRHALVSVNMDNSAPAACRVLRERGMPYAVHMRYGEADAQGILSGEAAQRTASLGAAFIAFVARSDCPADTRRRVHEYADREREAQRLPGIVCELAGDARAVDAVISGDGCTAGFLSDGTFFTVGGALQRTHFNLLDTPLRGILAAALLK